jgi:threonine dehydratase
LVVEPGGAIGLAALLAGKISVKGKIVVGILSGGNVDADMFDRLIAA